MKILFKPKPRSPADLVSHTRDLLAFAVSTSDHRTSKRDDEKMTELCKNVRHLKLILYGNGDAEPFPEACSQLTQEFFREDTLRPLIMCLPMLDLEARKDASQIVANLQRQQVQSRLIALDYLEANLDVIDMLVEGFENEDLALHYSGMLKECVRHQELLTRHRSTVSEYLAKNYGWFFTEYNTRLLEKGSYITKRQAAKLLGDVLMDRSNFSVMMRYVSSKDNLRIMMNLLREPTKNIKLEAFYIFKLFVAKENKPQDIVAILVANRSKIIRLLANLKLEKEDEGFEADKYAVLKEIECLTSPNQDENITPDA
ncbi:PREDICTED: MO25-like protein At2g03410 isoform X2 [Tarenaya hassleriana]|uniref:MO25-like protein At2g03410 isoform X2 n=1 Tax=Tarenaya hassleriana TaxID=28532 RepID=UPI00053C3FB7|nr:PREDICTED: MO25-like protein At2g03410 isoform X2 [Tarenaya hassleriana]